MSSLLQHRLLLRTLFCLLVLVGKANADPFIISKHDVVIVGGSTAALAAAVASARSGARTALLEPTDWIGGQITSSGVPAIDEAWHSVNDDKTGELLINVSAVARDPRNMSPLFRDMLSKTGNPGKGWVSRYCFEPRRFLQQQLEPLVSECEPKLIVYRDTVIKRAEFDRDGRRLIGVVAVRRTPRAGVADGGYDRLLSQDLVDWYSVHDSQRFTKETLTFRAPVFVDATEWGELLALAEADYRIGTDEVTALSQADPEEKLCGQSTVFGFVQEILQEAMPENLAHEEASGLGYGLYENHDDAWQRIWTYRRLRGTAAVPQAGDLSLQNWGYSEKVNNGGNDFPFGYLFKSPAATKQELADWQGGIDRQVIAGAEQRALAWHTWLKEKTPEPLVSGQVHLARHVLGTGHGLSKLPYVRDTRRSVGIDGFMLSIDDLVMKEGRRFGTRFDDRIAIGAYAVDVHPLLGCQYPDFNNLERRTLPFYIPLRALTNNTYDNLLVAGKTMAQTFVANSATRLHPIEWSSGIAAGVIAADLARSGQTTRVALADHQRLQRKVAKFTPIDWSE